MAAVESMPRANQSIDHPAISEKSSMRQEQGYNLRNAMNAVRSPATE